LKELLENLERTHAKVILAHQNHPNPAPGDMASRAERGVWINARNKLGKLIEELRQDIP
jgi:hypothetical protein